MSSKFFLIWQKFVFLEQKILNYQIFYLVWCNLKICTRYDAWLIIFQKTIYSLQKCEFAQNLLKNSKNLISKKIEVPNISCSHPQRGGLFGSLTPAVSLNVCSKLWTRFTNYNLDVEYFYILHDHDNIYRLVQKKYTLLTRCKSRHLIMEFLKTNSVT